MYVLERWLGWLIEYLSILVLLVVLSVCYTGCIWLAVPSVAYEGYKYEHQLSTRSSAGSGGSPSNSQPQPASRDSASSDHSIE
jgi:hypothetical protein